MIVKFHYNDPLDCSFSFIHLDASLANALRRILIAEVPTLAIEKVYVSNNTSIIADEVLSARLGLIPLKGALDGLNFLTWRQKGDPENDEEEEGAMDYNTIVLKLQIQCTRNEAADKNENDPKKKYNNAHVYASDLKFLPQGRQEQFFHGEGAVRAVNPDILIAKLRPGHEIDMELHCVKGRGMDHAKFSPVATASYRLLPKIDILKPITGDDAREFQECFPKGVIGLERVTAHDIKQQGSEYEGLEGYEKAVVKDAFRDTVSRECLRHDKFKNKVKLGRVQDHFIFSVESTGQFNSDLLVLESIKILKIKAMRLRRALNEYLA